MRKTTLTKQLKAIQLQGRDQRKWRLDYVEALLERDLTRIAEISGVGKLRIETRSYPGGGIFSSARAYKRTKCIV